ncbi:MAG TPA: RNA-binding domain-containing protein [Longimicrobium sp.]|nr:RNA-binding domain-containing protein [Longimicrobium sp.]
MTPDTHDEANASTLREIERVVARGESLQVEFKRTTGQRTDAAKTICGMLNASGGFVVFGVSDDGRILGQQVTAGTLADVARELGRIDPQALLSPEVVELDGGNALVLVRVPRGDGPYTYDGRPYLRVGPTTVLMGTAEYQRRLVERMHFSIRWETQAAQGVTIADLDADEIVRTAEEAMRRTRLEDAGSRRVEDLLLGFGLLRDGELLNAAAVLFCRADRLRLLYPQCALRLARFRGRDMAEFIDNRQETGNAFRLCVSHELTELQRELLALLSELGPSSSVVLQGRLSQAISNTYILRNLNQLQEMALIEKTGSARSTTWRLIGQPRRAG